MKPSSNMKLQRKNLIAITVIIISIVSIMVSVQATEDDKKGAETPKPALTVTTDKPQITRLAQTLSANGNVAAWQEAIIGNETDGLRLSEVKVNVGDQVRRGQVLATFAAETVAADLAQIQAGVGEARAHFAEAVKNAQRARDAKGTGAWSEQQINRYLTEEQTAKARLEAQQAAAKIQQLRLKQTRVLASDSGVISSRSATMGAVLPTGQELFRLIRQNRLEWRAEVTSAELAHLKSGDPASITTPGGSIVQGKMRMIAPTVDQKTRLGLVYVDLPGHPELKTGMFAKGKFELGSDNALTVLQQAVVMRDGFSYVFKLGTDNRVSQVKVRIGRRSGDRIEVLDGLQTDAVLVTSGAGFLNDGDLVKVIALPASTQNSTTNPNS
jgi:RND family efflux transporter MFP subunit